MLIDRAKAKQVFDEYVDKYDRTDEKIKLKIEHTYRVSELCEKIALSLGLKGEELDIAWIIGLLHDVGRFEQVRRYGTFNDFNSINHAKLGCEILFKAGKIREFIYDNSEDELIEFVIENHNAYRIPENITERFSKFTNILRDADKIDIFKVNVIVPMEKIYNVTSEELYNSVITKEVLDNLKRKDTVLRSLRKSAVDNVIGHISLVFGLVYDESIKIVKEQGCLYKTLGFKSKNSETNRQLKDIQEFVEEYLSKY